MKNGSSNIPLSFANGYFEPVFDLNYDLIENPVSTFYGRAKGFSMKEAGIDDGDLLVIDKSLEYKNGALAVCHLDGEFTLKRIKKERDKLYITATNGEFQPIEIRDNDEIIIWGIVTYVVKKAY